MACGSQLRSRPQVCVFSRVSLGPTTSTSPWWPAEATPSGGRLSPRTRPTLGFLSLGPSGSNCTAAAATPASPPPTRQAWSPITPPPRPLTLPPSPAPPRSHGGQLQQQVESLSAGCGGLWSNSWGLFFLLGRTGGSSSPHFHLLLLLLFP